MKKVLILAMSLAVVASASAQGIFNGNTGAAQIGTAGKCFEYNGGAAGTVALGATSSGQWYVGAAGITKDPTADATLTIPTGMSTVGAPKAFSSTGYCLPGSITTTFAGGSTISVLFTAWHNNVGGNAITDFATGSTVAGGFHGESAVIQVVGLSTGIATPPQVVGFQGFTLTPNIPEPSTIALGVMGLSLLAFRRRK
jgi:hypothetical protein